MIGLILLILIVFSTVWFAVWFWFFKPSSPTENFYKMALQAFEIGDYKKAKEFFMQLSNINSNADAKYKLGVSLMKLRDYEGAKGCFEQVLKKSPKKSDVWSNLAQVLQFQQKYDEALEIYNKMAENKPKSTECFLNIFNLYYNKGDYSKALEILEKAKEEFSDNSEILFSIIKCKSAMIDKDNDEECERILKEYINIASRKDLPEEFNIAIAKAYAMNGELYKSLEYCQKGIGLNSENVEAYQMLGLLQLVKRDFEGAKTNLTMALNFQPNNRETHNLFSYVMCLPVDSCPLGKCRENYFKLIRKR